MNIPNIPVIIDSIVKLAKTIAPTLMAVNKTRIINNQTQSLALAQKRDNDTQQLAMKRMEFDAKMEMIRQTVRAKERQEDKEFSLTLKAMEAETLLRQEKMRQAFQALEAEKQREFTQAIEKFKAEVQIVIQADNIAFQKWKTETDQKFAIEIRFLDAQITRQRDKQNRDDARRDRNSPVFAVTDDILETIHNRPEMPLTVFFSPPVLRYEPWIERNLSDNPLCEQEVKVLILSINAYLSNRDDRIRTCGILLPKQARYQAALHPVNLSKPSSTSIKLCSFGSSRLS